jgi:hypothetical protein
VRREAAYRLVWWGLWVATPLIALEAQSLRELSPGTPVRVWRRDSAPQPDTRLFIHLQTADSLVLRTHRRDAPGTRLYGVPMVSLSRLDRWQPHSRKRGALRGVAWGFLAGATAAGIAELALNDEDEIVAATVVPIFIGSGIVGGAVLGSAVPGGRWVRVWP